GVDLVLGEHTLEQEEAGLGEEVGGIVVALAEPESLFEVERAPVTAAHLDVARPVDGAPVDGGPQHRIPRAERVVRGRVAVDASTDDETERGAALVHEVAERLAVEPDG